MANSTNAWPSSRPILFLMSMTVFMRVARSSKRRWSFRRLAEAPDGSALERVDDVVDGAGDRGRKTGPRGDKQNADDDDRENEGVLDEGLAALALDAGEERADPSVETIEHEVCPPVGCEGDCRPAFSAGSEASWLSLGIARAGGPAGGPNYPIGRSRSPVAAAYWAAPRRRRRPWDVPRRITRITPGEQWTTSPSSVSRARWSANDVRSPRAR